MNHFTVVVMRLTPGWLLQLSGREDKPQVYRQIQNQLFHFCPLKDSREAAVSLSESWSNKKPSECYAECPATTPAITRLCPQSVMNHILLSPPKIHRQPGERLTFSSCEWREHFKILKGQVMPRMYWCWMMSAGVSMAAGLDRSGSLHQCLAELLRSGTSVWTSSVILWCSVCERSMLLMIK